jgi:hypothetical protein
MSPPFRKNVSDFKNGVVSSIKVVLVGTLGIESEKILNIFIIIEKKKLRKNGNFYVNPILNFFLFIFHNY